MTATGDTTTLAVLRAQPANGSVVRTEAVRAGPAEVRAAWAAQRQRDGRRRLEVGELPGPARERAQAFGGTERAMAECAVVAGPRRLEDHVAV